MLVVGGCCDVYTDSLYDDNEFCSDGDNDSIGSSGVNVIVLRHRSTCFGDLRGINDIAACVHFIVHGICKMILLCSWWLWLCVVIPMSECFRQEVRCPTIFQF